MKNIKQIPAKLPISERTSGVSVSGSVDRAKAGYFYMDKLYEVNLQTKAVIYTIRRDNLKQLIRKAYLSGKVEAINGNTRDEHKKFIEEHKSYIDQILPWNDTEGIQP